MSRFHELSGSVLASAQITTADVELAHAEGVRLIINNRPDGEAPDQPPGSEIEAAARAAGIDYVAIPVSPGGFDEGQVRAMADALANADGKVLAYCRSGTRSTLLWALAQAAAGSDPQGIADAAADAGYDVSPIRGAIDRLSAQASR
ncbi:TIGR01244 family phosphatase [Altererythrobacter soli]|uniref:TIGR01244 family phosphatase n=1 Tax=Croceibacterium soli TaxID=1739690 RepID=A0A6I4URA0_9SPHN|nr:TIGR01244 family sulfur transferase [Croceibacterium soli]MXP40067.1 TIGR01244 family phosphatase [Croceibacterium soli]